MFTKVPHRQEIYFDDGSMRVISKVTKIEQGRWFHIVDDQDREFVVNPAKVLFVRVTKK
jgi:hypothetical protein